MKKTLLTSSLLTLCAAVSLNAQTVLNASNTIPAPGTTQTFSADDSFRPNMGAAGSGQTWDFTGVNTSVTQDLLWVRPSQTNDGSSFPAAPLATTASAGGQTVEEFFEITNTTFKMLGQTVDGIARLTCADEREIFQFPMSLGTTGTGNWSGTMDVFSNPFMIDRKGNTTWNADASGSLITSSGTTTGVLKVVWTSNYSDEMVGVPIGTYSDTVVWWFDGKTPGPMATYTVNWSNGQKLLERTLLRTNITVDVHNHEAVHQVDLFPNPASTQVTLTGVQKVSKVEVLSLDGRIIELAENYGLNELTIDLDSYEPGMYIARFEIDGVMQSKRFVVK